jgi:hypothetical protein
MMSSWPLRANTSRPVATSNWRRPSSEPRDEPSARGVPDLMSRAVRGKQCSGAIERGFVGRAGDRPDEFVSLRIPDPDVLPRASGHGEQPAVGAELTGAMPELRSDRPARSSATGGRSRRASRSASWDPWSSDERPVAGGSRPRPDHGVVSRPSPVVPSRPAIGTWAIACYRRSGGPNVTCRWASSARCG